MEPARFAAPLNHEIRPAIQWVEAASSLQIPSFHIVGLPSQEISEARERIRAAIESSGLEFPRRRVVLNLSPANIRKQGTGLDLAMALAVLASRDEPRRRGAGDRAEGRGRWAAWGELGLDGRLKPCGQLMRALVAAQEAGIERVLVANDELEAALEKRELLRAAGEPERALPEVHGASSLQEAWERVRGLADPARASPARAPTTCAQVTPSGFLPLSASLERALGAAAAGAHHLLLLGPRGTGKSHALEWFIALQPPLSARQQLHQLLVAELSRPDARPSPRPPVRRIGLQARPGALTGSADSVSVRPGEFSQADGGVLVADELPEWPRDSRESLREPLERGRITLNRVRGSVELPARFTLAANGNFCPCGGWPREIPPPPSFDGSSSGESGGGLASLLCRCPARDRVKYLGRLSGPILDRIDLLVRTLQSDASTRPGRPLPLLQEKVSRARDRACLQWGKPPGLLEAGELEEIARSRPRWLGELERTRASSLRSRHKILRLALSLASWDGLDEPSPFHFVEAATYRPERAGLI